MRRGNHYSAARHQWVLLSFATCALALSWRAFDLQLTQREFLQDAADARHLRVVETPARRGVITDRHGEPLAVSTPVHSVWAVPRQLLGQKARLPALAALLGTSAEHLEAILVPRIDSEFAWLRRHLEPAVAERVRALAIPGVSLTREFRRYYPAGEVTAHVLGFTNVDDRGQEGLELALDGRLRGESGEKRVVKDRLGRIVEELASLRPTRPGEDLALSIDKRVQYVAYRELKTAIQAHRARSGSVVILDARTGEVLAMVNQPSYNPNNRQGPDSGRYRNRAVTDVFEPGSTVKPFTIAAALEAGAVRADTRIDTGGGPFRVGGHYVRDVHENGVLDVTGVIVKSSNIGTAKIALALEPGALWGVFAGVGFGLPSGAAFPGEQRGHLAPWQDWGDIEQATLSFGYGLSTTALQLARAYALFAGDGVVREASFLRREEPAPGTQVIAPATAHAVRAMLEAVVLQGTGQLARVPGYRVGGKTGTVHKVEVGGYAEDRYLSLFAGLVPVSDPRLVAAVIIDEPQGGEYFGGRVAAPVFARIMEDVLRLLDVAPDGVESPAALVAAGPGRQRPSGAQP